VFGTILQRMIFWDLVKVFAVTLVGLTGLFVLAGLVAEISQRGLAPAQVFGIIPLMIPSMLPYTIPAATLFATVNVYGRMAKDNEIVALRAAGVNLRAILAPSLLLGLGGSAATAGLYYQVIPGSFQMVRDHLLSDTNELLYTVLKRNGCINDKRLPFVLFVRDVRGTRLIDAIFKRKIPKTNGYDTVARAQEARLRVETKLDPVTGKPVNDLVVEMTNFVVCNDQKKGASPTLLTVRKQEYRERLPTEDKDAPRACDLAWPELLKRTDVLRTKQSERSEEINRDEARANSMSKGEREWLDARKNGQRYETRTFRSFLAEIQLRPALAFGCLCFAMIGGPIGVWTCRADLLSSFVIGFLPAVGLYYPLLLCATNLAKNGKVPMTPAVWSADVVFAFVAVLLSWRLTRR
jgi:lipopolysaccharide export system permease protein